MTCNNEILGERVNRKVDYEYHHLGEIILKLIFIVIKQLSEVLILQRGMNINFKSVTCHTEDSSVTASDIAFMLAIIIPKVRLWGFFLSSGMQIPPSPIKSTDLLYIWADRAKPVVWDCYRVKLFFTLDSWLTQSSPTSWPANSWEKCSV